MKRRTLLIIAVVVLLAALLLMRLNFNRQYDSARSQLDALPAASSPP